MRKNAKYKLLLPAFILFIIGMGSLSAIVYINSKEALIKAAEDQMVQIAGLARENVDLWIDEIRMALDSWNEQDILRTATRDGFLGKAARRSVNRELAKYKEKYGYYETISLASIQGVIIASSDTRTIDKISSIDQKYLAQSMDDGLQTPRVIISPLSKRPVFVIAGPVKRENQVVGVLFATVVIDDFKRRFVDPIKIGETGYAFIFDTKGNVFVHPDPHVVFEMNMTDFDFGRQMLAEENGVLKAKWPEKESLIVYRKSAVTGWIIGVNAPIDQLFAPVNRIGRLNIFLCVFIVTLTGLVIYVVAKMGIIGTIDGLIKAREAAESATRAKNNFLATMSHEIRTPMNAIIGMTDMVLATELNPKQQKHLVTAKKSANHLLNLINNILDFSKIEARKFKLESVPFDLPLLIEEIRSILAYKAERKGLTIKSIIDRQTPNYLSGDPQRLRQIIFNLVNNAVKFTETGEVRIRVQPVPVGKDSIENRTKVLFSIEDSGPGIPADKIETIFDSFTQLDGSYSRRHGGTGLGLSICRELVHLMGGKITCNSTVGEGSIFSFKIRFKLSTSDQVHTIRSCVEPPSSGDPGNASKNPLNILLADDFEVNQQLITPILEERGHRVRLVANGEEVLKAVNEEHFDLILMDVQMPVMDGIEATCRLRRNKNQTIATIPIIAITAHALVGDREKFIQSGMDDYVAKPIDMKILLNAIAKVTPYCSPGDVLHDSPRGHLKIVDLDYALQLMDGELAVLKAACQTMVKKLPGKIADLKDAITTKDSANVRRLSHGLKAAAKSVGADSAADTAFRMETLATGPAMTETMAEAIELMPELDQEFHKVIKALDETLFFS